MAAFVCVCVFSQSCVPEPMYMCIQPIMCVSVCSGLHSVLIGDVLLFSSDDDDEGKDTTIYFCTGRDPETDPVTPVTPDSSLTRGCRGVEPLGTVLVTGELDWEELRVITYGPHTHTIHSILASDTSVIKCSVYI